MARFPDTPVSLLVRIVSEKTGVCDEAAWTRLFELYAPAIKAFAEERGLWYVNTQQCNEEIGIDYTTDTCDMGQHLNVYGAEKLSRWLGSELTKRFDLPDRRTDAVYAPVWAEKTARYEAEKATSAAGQ